MWWIHLLYIEQAESHVVYFRVLQGHFQNCQFSPSLRQVNHALEANQVSSHYQGIENAWWLWQGRQAWHASNEWRLHHTLAQWTFDLGFVRRERFASWAHTLTKSLMRIQFKEITLFVPLFLTNNYWWAQFWSDIRVRTRITWYCVQYFYVHFMRTRCHSSSCEPHVTHALPCLCTALG
jgi:hypothetical protein